jgi:hypothetical protein
MTGHDTHTIECYAAHAVRQEPIFAKEIEMRKSVSKLKLAKETLRNLGADLSAVAGGMTYTTVYTQCGGCPPPPTGTSCAGSGCSEFCGGA